MPDVDESQLFTDPDIGEQIPYIECPMAEHYYESPHLRVKRYRGTRDWLLTYTAGGKGRFGYNGGEISSLPHDLVLIRPGAVHDYGTYPGADHWERYWVHFQPRQHWTPFLEWPTVADGLQTLTLTDEIMQARVTDRMAAVVRHSKSGLPYHKMLAMAILEEVLLECAIANLRSANQNADKRITLAIDYLHENLASDVRLEDLCTVTGLSMSHLGNLFRTETGQTPQQFLEIQRMELAKQRLDQTTLPIKAIAVEVGYDSQFYFSLRFKKYTGLSPQHYRNRPTAPFRPGM